MGVCVYVPAFALNAGKKNVEPFFWVTDFLNMFVCMYVSVYQVLCLLFMQLLD